MEAAELEPTVVEYSVVDEIRVDFWLVDCRTVDAMLDVGTTVEPVAESVVESSVDR